MWCKNDKTTNEKYITIRRHNGNYSVFFKPIILALDKYIHSLTSRDPYRIKSSYSWYIKSKDCNRYVSVKFKIFRQKLSISLYEEKNCELLGRRLIDLETIVSTKFTEEGAPYSDFLEIKFGCLDSSIIGTFRWISIKISWKWTGKITYPSYI